MRSRDAGVTLVEVLVVLVLVGVMAGAIGLSLGPSDRGNALAQEADLLTARLLRAADEALLTGMPVAFVWEDAGYRFEVPGPEGWVPHPIAILGTPHPLDTVAPAEAEGRFVLSPDLLPADGAPLQMVLRDGGRDAIEIRFDGVTASQGPEA